MYIDIRQGVTFCGGTNVNVGLLSLKRSFLSLRSSDFFIKITPYLDNE